MAVVSDPEPGSRRFHKTVAGRGQKQPCGFISNVSQNEGKRPPSPATENIQGGPILEVSCGSEILVSARIWLELGINPFDPIGVGQ